MRVSDILRTKGGETVTVAPDSDVRSLVALLGQRRIGAVVLSGDGLTIAGIVSERDVVHALAEHGSDVLDMPVSSICTVEGPHRHGGRARRRADAAHDRPAHPPRPGAA